MKNKLLILSLLIAVNFLYGQTTIPAGTIDGDTWHKDDSPFHIGGNLTVANLTIEAGVEILFDDNYNFEVNGKLIAKGFYSDSILFSPDADNSNGWGGIKFTNGSDSSSLQYCHMEKANNQSISINNSNPYISNCRFTFNQGNGITLKNTQSRISNCFIGNNNLSGIYTDNSRLTLDNCIIANNTQYGINSINVSDTLIVTNSVIADNDNYGISSLSGIVIVKNSILDNGSDIDASSPQVSYSNIIEGIVSGAGNISSDPKFKDRLGYRLSDNSPCIDSGDPAAIYDDKFFPPSLAGKRNDMGAYGGSGAGNSYPPLTTLSNLLDFGMVKLNNSEKMSVKIFNYRDYPITVTSIDFSNDAFSADISGFSMAPYDTFNLEITFTPDRSNLFNENINLQSENDGIFTLDLKGQGISPDIDIPLVEINFSSVNIGSSDSSNITITNRGYDTLRISQISTTNPVFTSNKSDLTVNPRSTDDINIYFNPDSAKSYIDSLIIISNDPDKGRLSFPLKGSGNGPVIAVDKDSLNFEHISLIPDTTLSLIVSNLGNQPLSIQSLNIEQTETVFSIENESLPINIAPAASYTLQLRYKALNIGTDNALLKIISSDALRNEKTIHLRGPGQIPKMAIPQQALSFGDVDIITSKTDTIYIHNQGDAPLTIDSLNIYGSEKRAFSVADTELPLAVNPLDSFALAIRFQPLISDSNRAILSIHGDDLQNPTAVVNLQGFGLTPKLELSKTEINFGNIMIDSSITDTFLIGNRGEGTLLIDSLVIKGENIESFKFIQTDTTNITVKADSSFIVSIRFAPAKQDTNRAQVIIYSNTITQKDSLILSGQGQSPVISTDKDTLNFEEISLIPDTSLAIIITNSGEYPLSIKQMNIEQSDTVFNIIGNNLPIEISSGDSVSYRIQYNALKTGIDRGLLNILSNDPLNSKKTITLIGPGQIPKMELSQKSISYGKTDIVSIKSDTIFVYNRGDAILTIDSLRFSGLQKAAFSTNIVESSTISPFDSLAVEIHFTPITADVNMAVLSIYGTDFSNPLDSISLSGYGLFPELEISRSTLNFGDVNLYSSRTDTFRIYNGGEGTLLIDSLIISAINQTSFRLIDTDSAGIIIKPDSIFTAAVRFSPSIQGNNSAKIFIYNNSSVEKDSLSLIGKGIAPQIEISKSTVLFDTIALGSQPLTISDSLFIKNSGTGTLHLYIDQFEFTGDTSSFSLNLVKTDSLLNPNDSTVIYISLHTTKTGELKSQFKIVCNDPNSSVIPIDITAFAKDKAAEITYNSEASSKEFIINEPATLSFIIQTYSSIEEALINYKRGGESDWHKETLQKNGTTDNWSITLDKDRLSSRGLEYFITIKHGYTNSMWPLNGYQTIQTVIPELNSVVTTRDNFYQEFSIPMAANNLTLSALLYEKSGEYNSANFRIFDCLDGKENIELKNGEDTLTPGKAYWLITKDSLSIDISDTTYSVPTDAPYSIHLHQGWNLIASPFPFPVSWAEVDTTLALRYFTVNGDWAFAEVLKPYLGYAVYTQNETTLSIIAKETDKTDNLNKIQTNTAEKEWNFQLLAEAGELRDSYNYAGVKRNSSNEIDIYDYPEPSSIGNFVSLYFTKSTAPTTHYSTDFRSAGEDGYIFDFELSSNINNEKNITVIDNNLPKEYSWIIVSPKTKRIYTENKIKTLDKTASYRLIIGTDSFIEEIADKYSALPTSFQLSQNYPNPFNPVTTINYQLAKRSTVTIEVYNILGQRIDRLLDKKPQEAGYYQLAWNGTNNKGKKVSSGLYFLFIRTENINRGIKMILQR